MKYFNQPLWIKMTKVLSISFFFLKALHYKHLRASSWPTLPQKDLPPKEVELQQSDFSLRMFFSSHRSGFNNTFHLLKTIILKGMLGSSLKAF